MRGLLVAITGLATGLSGGAPIGAAEPNAVRAADGQPTKAADKSRGKKTETAVFAGGCFWCTEFAFEQLAGVIDVESGYCGGTKGTANYEQVRLGTTAHAEAIRVTYDPDKITYDELLTVFFDAHDPTQLNRQGADIGRQYRSAIFFANEEQQKLAQAKIADLESRRVYKKRIVTKVEPLKEFYPAEDYHQNFARRNPSVPYIQGHAIPKALRVRQQHPGLVRQGE
jgi:methionine-S-sulfoxide reductase